MDFEVFSVSKLNFPAKMKEIRKETRSLISWQICTGRTFFSLNILKLYMEGAHSTSRNGTFQTQFTVTALINQCLKLLRQI